MTAPIESGERSPKRVLITNDDGIFSPGLEVLEACAKLVFADVTVVAPATEKSAVGQSITLHDPMRCRKLASKRWSVTGTPADCVLVALGHLMAEDGPPNLVLSGINRGPNLGYDVFYSGTVGGAREGQVKGIPGVALSLAGSGPFDFEALSPAVTAILRNIAAQELDPGILLNVNIPPAVPGAEAGWHGVPGLQGVQVTQLGHRSYRDEIIVRKDPRGRRYVWLGGEFPTLTPDPGTDCGAIAEGYASITPLQLDTTDRAAMTALTARFAADE